MNGVGSEAARPSVSALVVARNEAARLGACLATLGFADEIVVVLDRSTDESAAIARAAGARLVEGEWALEGPRRMAGIAACRGDWIVEVDADERVPPALAREIRERIGQGDCSIYLVPMANHIGERPVRFGWGAYNGVAAKASLFRAGAKIWGEGRVHPRITLTGTQGKMEQPLDHFVYRDVSDMMRRLNRYTDLAVLDAREAGTGPHLRTALRRAASRGWKSYVARRGYREGVYGVALALYSALYPVLIDLKLAIPPSSEGSV